MAQRLIRRICGECKDINPNPDRFKLKLLGITDEDLAGHHIHHGTGCTRCSNIGYRGRQGIFELMEMTL
jgi:type II secretory ATPase GspE/PulE/Tfp pilus assembly ATPase PilB-like protein